MSGGDPNDGPARSVERLGDGAFDPRFLAARASGTADGWRALAEEVAPHAWRVPMLTPEFATTLLGEIDARRQVLLDAGEELDAPNSMHAHGVALDELLLEWVLDDLLANAVRPIARHLFTEFAGADLDAHHGYLVEYAKDADQDLGFHVDDSEVTLNLCLGDAPFDGSELTLMGLRCELHRQTVVFGDETIEVEHRPGTAILHAGAHRHRVEPIRRGRRRNLILWCRASSRRGGARTIQCEPWCGMYAGPQRAAHGRPRSS
ncbi:hypothetical protein Pla163_03030 [Planctomycetes bacterium Pla163]|uniref:Fe2OG dioxygenase domain-containing protein n=1 Tax=Rohdeia mirabilis TaxID=2528008 RepID=A0A518CVF7_9BACT|nr:hypothetical protein Pla163_03030 [Planctomycetes bacterium Pla163]